MNRLAGIVIAVLGLIVAVLSALKVVPGLTQAGIVMILLGGLVIGLSFVRKPQTDDVPRMSTPETLLNIFVSPSETFQNLRRHPRWLVATLIMIFLGVTFSNLFLYRLTPERVTNYAIDKTLQMSWINEEARRQIEAGRQEAIDESKNPIAKTGQAVTSFAGWIFWFAFLAAVFFVFALAMGGKMNYWQAFSVAVYATFPVMVIRYVLSSIILFLKDPVDVHPILGQSQLVQDNLSFLVTPSESAVLYTLLASLSILWFYWIWLNATGLKNAGERVSSSTGWAATLSVYGLVLVIGVISSYLFSGFFA